MRFADVTGRHEEATTHVTAVNNWTLIAAEAHLRGVGRGHSQRPRSPEKVASEVRSCPRRHP
jgi:hypothetical protein